MKNKKQKKNKNKNKHPKNAPEKNQICMVNMSEPDADAPFRQPDQSLAV